MTLALLAHGLFGTNDYFKMMNSTATGDERKKWRGRAWPVGLGKKTVEKGKFSVGKGKKPVVFGKKPVPQNWQIFCTKKANFLYQPLKKIG